MTTTDQVTEYLRSADLLTVRLATAQSHLGLSERVLCKRLQQEGTTFGKLLDAERERRLEQGQAGTLSDIGFRTYNGFSRWQRRVDAH